MSENVNCTTNYFFILHQALPKTEVPHYLVHSFEKLVTNILANRLVGRLQ
jgi:hypothetical protein